MKNGLESEQDKPQDTTPESSVEHVFRTIRLVMTLFSILFAILLAILGFVGLQTASNIESIVERRLAAIISEKSDESSTLSKMIIDLTKNIEMAQDDVDDLTGDIADAKTALQLGDTDPVGDYLRLRDEVKRDSTTLISAEGRKRAEIVFSKLLADDGTDPSTKKADGGTLFNAAGLASEFLMPHFATALAQSAWERNDAPHYAARMHRTMIETGEADKDEGFHEVFQLVRSLKTTHQIHLTLSEAFNVAVVDGRMSELIAALETLKQSLADQAPSYVWILQAEALLVEGSHGSVRQAIDELEVGLERASLESPLASWFADTLSDGAELLTILERHPEFREAAIDIRTEFTDLLSFEMSQQQDGIGLDSFDLLSSLFEEREPLFMADEYPPTPDYELSEIVLNVPQVVRSVGWIWFLFSVDEGGYFSVEAIAGDEDVDPVVIVRDDGGALLGNDDDGGEGLASRLVIQLHQGDYAIGVGPALGGYTVEGATVIVKELDG